MANLLNLLNADPCEPQSLSEAVKKILDEFEEEIEDTIKDLANQSFGPFIVTLFALMGQLTAALATNLSSFLLSAVVGNIVGGLLASVGLALNMVAGFQIMLKYLAAKALKEVLERREKLANNLLFDIEELLDMLQSLQEVDSNSQDVLLNDVTSAHQNVKAALRLLGAEYSKIENAAWYRTGSGSINQNSLDSAVYEIDEALRKLAGDQLLSPDFQKELNRLNRRYGLPLIPTNKVTDSAQIPHPLGIVEYFKNSVSILKDKYINDTGGVTDEGKRKIKEYLLAFIGTPGVNDFFIKYSTSRFTKKYIHSIGRHLPIQSVILKDSKVIQSNLSRLKGGKMASITDNIKSSIDSVFDYLELEDAQTVAKYSSKDINHATESRIVKVQETSVLLMDQWIETVGYETGILRTFLGPAVSKLKDVDSGMEDVLSRRGEFSGVSGKADLGESKIEWIVKLNIAKTLANSSGESPILFGSGTTATAEQIGNKFDRSLDLYEELRTYILNRTVKETSPGEFEEVPRESDLIAEISESKLQVLGATPFLVVSPDVRRRTIAALQSIRLLLKTQRDRDEQERLKCEAFIRSVDTNPLFNSVIKPAWEAFINSLGFSPLSGDLADQLLRGDLSKLLNGIQAGLALSDDITEFLACKSKESQEVSEDSVRLAEVIGLDPEKAKKFTRKSEQSINRLKNKKEIIGAMLNLGPS